MRFPKISYQKKMTIACNTDKRNNKERENSPWDSIIAE
jgi:hypothetical protein